MDTIFLREALYKGKTGNSFTLGTALTLGWFWSRVKGCSLLYRGDDVEQFEFANIIASADVNVEQISPPSYLQHNNNSTCFYLIRRVNGCGYQEYTLSAAVKIAIDNNGNLASPRPNSIRNIKVKQIANGKMQLLWYYCPLEQEIEPDCFKIFCDNGTGQINYENPIALIKYVGRKFYRYQSNIPEAGRYIFVIKAQDTAGTESNIGKILSVCTDTNIPNVIEILSLTNL